MGRKTKTKQTDAIKAIKVGKTDECDNTITDVLATGVEYAIYEIDTADINRRLRVFIDAESDEREQEVVEYYIQVKQLYIKAKGLLYRTSNFGMMKNRVAHTLATALAGHPAEAAKQFEALIEEIDKEYKDAFNSRLLYVLPGYTLLTILLIYLAFVVCDGVDTPFSTITNWLIIAVAAIIGGNFSMTLNMKNMTFDREINNLIYAAYGMERISIALLAGIICTFGIRAEFIFKNVSSGKPDDVWSTLFIVSMAAFSEKMVPNIIQSKSKKA